MDGPVLSVPPASVLFLIDFPRRRLGTAELAALVPAVGQRTEAVDDAERIDRIRILEELKSAVAAAQLEETAAFVASQRRAQKAAGVRAERVGRGIAHQVALAKRTSSRRGHHFVQAAAILTGELPATLAELAVGRTTDWRATIVARETAWLSREHRAQVDQALAPRLERLGDRAVEAETKKLAYRLDPRGYVDRLALATGDRRVTLRPAPETMARLGALLPVAQGVAAYAALGRDADALRAQGDPRSRGHGDGEPAVLEGYGPIPAETARHLITDLADETPVGLRRLYTRPATGELSAMDSNRRFFGGSLRRFITYRDQYCRTPWCGAPIRHHDHVTSAERDGPTSAANGQGLCEACNQAKETLGWSAAVINARGRHETEIRTPTGHRYRSAPPDPPGSPVEEQVRRIIDTVWAA